MYTKERMYKFGMTQNNLCDHCGDLEDLRHMLWDCNRVKHIWTQFAQAFLLFDPGGEITYESLFIGYNPTIIVLESVITRITRSIVSRERQNTVQLCVIKKEVIEHCSCNIYSIRKNTTIKRQWEQLKTIINDLN